MTPVIALDRVEGPRRPRHARNPDVEAEALYDPRLIAAEGYLWELVLSWTSEEAEVDDTLLSRAAALIRRCARDPMLQPLEPISERRLRTQPSLPIMLKLDLLLLRMAREVQVPRDHWAEQARAWLEALKGLIDEDRWRLLQELIDTLSHIQHVVVLPGAIRRSLLRPHPAVPLGRMVDLTDGASSTDPGLD